MKETESIHREILQGEKLCCEWKYYKKILIRLEALAELRQESYVHKTTFLTFTGPGATFSIEVFLSEL